MNKEQVVMAMLEKINNDTRSMGVQNGIQLSDIEQQIIHNQPGLIYILSNLYDFLLDKKYFS